MSTDPLREYRARRSVERSSEPGVDRTEEPSGDDVRSPGEAPLFVIQHHDASSEHWDVRFEVDGVLASWAVPKGPSTDPSEKRLAKQVEDHPLDYADFEGHIPEGEYGGGDVIVWDLGPYRNDTVDDDGEPVSMRDAIDDGHVRVTLDGEKLTGGFVLQQAKMNGDPTNWLLIKADDDGADARRNPTSTQRESVLSGRTVDDVAAEAEEES